MKAQNSIKDILLEGDEKEKELTQKEIQIIEAAIKIFSEKGFSASRTSEIAKEANIAEGTIFRYFKTKNDLLTGLLIPLFSRFFKPLILDSLEKLIKRDKDKPFEELLTEVLIDRYNLVKKNLPLIKTVAIESMYHPELLDPMKKDVFPKVLSYATGFIEEYVDNGMLKDQDPLIIVRTMMSSIMGYIFTTSLLPDLFPSDNPEEDIKKIAQVLLYGLAKEERSDFVEGNK